MPDNVTLNSLWWVERTTDRAERIVRVVALSLTGSRAQVQLVDAVTGEAAKRKRAASCLKRAASAAELLEEQRKDKAAKKVARLRNGYGCADMVEEEE